MPKTQFATFTGFDGTKFRIDELDIGIFRVWKWPPSGKGQPAKWDTLQVDPSESIESIAEWVRCLHQGNIHPNEAYMSAVMGGTTEFDLT